MNRKIGVIDSGIGGLTVVKSIQRLIPSEDIIYYGDNKNVPYGNKSKEEILQLTLNLLGFMRDNNVKLVAIACNTISTLVDEFKDLFDFKIMDIIHPAVEAIVKMNTYSLSIIGTEFTINSGLYQKLLLERNPDLSIRTESSKILAKLIDDGDFDSKLTKDTVRMHINNLQGHNDIYNLVLACTHFPIINNLFSEIDPQIKLIDPGFELSKYIRTYLEENNFLNRSGKGSIDIYTSGDSDIYNVVINRLKLKNILEIKKL